ncbi:GNAT family N-acetyltransferase [Serinibacter arcticus]|uniref:GNAT family N-acetyltransferase n=1 Tax=Serinibacter arcticus TaxID=1655435 RepID=A0A2U1ZUX5_9MICO|nr:GNAT family N-acetyltransferase [Serinibacter arcticus]PWD50769.1 GNAT family N-acetyltransferase [Serinibacter arcticus]
MTERVRPLDGQDLEAVASIYAHYVTASTATFETVPMTTQDWAEKAEDIARRGWPFLVAVTDDDGPSERVIGFAYTTFWRARPAYDLTVEETIYLEPGETGRGVGTALLTAVLDATRAAGARQAIAVVSDRGAEGSLALHRKVGFAEAGHLKAIGEKLGVRLGTYLLQKSLED